MAKASLVPSEGPNPAPLNPSLAAHYGDLRPAGHGYVILRLD